MPIGIPSAQGDAVGAKTAYIEPGSPWENGYCESFNSKLRDELLNGEVFFSLAEAQVLIEAWRRHYNTVRPHSSLGYRPPAPETIVPRSGGIAPWASAPAVGAARSPTPTMASELAVN
jgi:transposase InsO family protein